MSVRILTLVTNDGAGSFAVHRTRVRCRAAAVTRKVVRLCAWLATLLLIGLRPDGLAAQEESGASREAADSGLHQGPKAEAVAANVMVSTQLASSTEAAVTVLQAGGNAIDAALTALFVQQVHDYHMVFLFGSLSALVYDASSDSYYSLSAVSARPEASGAPPGSVQNVTIGGTVRGAAALADRFGTLPWEAYLEPAIQAAEQGALVTSFMYGLNFALFESGYLSDLRESEEARQFYMPDGHLVGVGRRWKMPALASTLRGIAAEGPDYMYTGRWGRRFVDAVRRGGGQISLEDMEAYRPIWAEPLRFTYRGQEIVGTPPPDGGAIEVGYNLNILENFDLRNSGHYSESVETIEIMARAMGRVFKETRGVIRDPLNHRVPTEVWLSREYGQAGAQIVRQSMPHADLSGRRADASFGSRAESGPSPAPIEELGSDHIVIADDQGNWVSLLHTVHGGAPGVFVDGVRATGSQFPADAAGPGRRLVLPITPLMFVGEDGAPWLAMGTPGNPPQPVTEVIVNMLDFDMGPQQAVVAPRFWAFRQGESLELEPRVDASVLAGLAARGIGVTNLGDYNFHTGSVQIVWRDPATGMLHGVTDPRRLGKAAGF